MKLWSGYVGGPYIIVIGRSIVSAVGSPASPTAEVCWRLGRSEGEGIPPVSAIGAALWRGSGFQDDNIAAWPSLCQVQAAERPGRGSGVWSKRRWAGRVRARVEGEGGRGWQIYVLEVKRTRALLPACRVLWARLPGQASAASSRPTAAAAAARRRTKPALTAISEAGQCCCSVCMAVAQPALQAMIGARRLFRPEPEQTAPLQVRWPGSDPRSPRLSG